MKKLLFVILFCAVNLISAEFIKIEFDKIPESVDEFLSLREKQGGTPEGSAALFVLAMKIYTVNQDLGLSCFTLILENNVNNIADAKTSDEKGSYNGKKPSIKAHFFIDRLKTQSYLPDSYFFGTSWETGYALPDGKLTVLVSRNSYSETSDNDIKVFIYCTGTDSPRPIRMKKNTAGIWKASEYSSPFVDIKPPKVMDDGDTL
jgi:hypothetical protein